MNSKRIIFSGIVTAVIGVGLGLVMVKLVPSPYTAELYKSLKSRYALIGGVAGLVFGASQEAVRQLKRQCDREEAIASRYEHSQAGLMLGTRQEAVRQLKRQFEREEVLTPQHEQS